MSYAHNLSLKTKDLVVSDLRLGSCGNAVCLVFTCGGTSNIHNKRKILTSAFDISTEAGVALCHICR